MAHATIDQHVRAVARRIHAALPRQVQLDDLVSAGWIGALVADRTFKPDLGVPIGAYREQKIRGAILEYVRNQDPLSRQHRDQVKKGAAPEVEHWSLDTQSEDGTVYQLPDPKSLGQFRAVEARLTVARYLKRLTPRARAVILAYAAGDKPREIARAHGLTANSIRTMVADSMAKLRARAEFWERTYQGRRAA